MTIASTPRHGQPVRQREVNGALWWVDACGHRTKPPLHELPGTQISTPPEMPEQWGNPEPPHANEADPDHRGVDARAEWSEERSRQNAEAWAYKQAERERRDNEIRARHQAGQSISFLANHFGLGKNTISTICRGPLPKPLDPQAVRRPDLAPDDIADDDDLGVIFEAETATSPDAEAEPAPVEDIAAEPEPPSDDELAEAELLLEAQDRADRQARAVALLYQRRREAAELEAARLAAEQAQAQAERRASEDAAFERDAYALLGELEAAEAIYCAALRRLTTIDGMQQPLWLNVWARHSANLFGAVPERFGGQERIRPPEREVEQNLGHPRDWLPLVHRQWRQWRDSFAQGVPQ